MECLEITCEYLENYFGIPRLFFNITIHINVLCMDMWLLPISEMIFHSIFHMTLPPFSSYLNLKKKTTFGIFTFLHEFLGVPVNFLEDPRNSLRTPWEFLKIPWKSLEFLENYSEFLWPKSCWANGRKCILLCKKSEVLLSKHMVNDHKCISICLLLKSRNSFHQFLLVNSLK